MKIIPMIIKITFLNRKNLREGIEGEIIKIITNDSQTISNEQYPIL